MADDLQQQAIRRVARNDRGASAAPLQRLGTVIETQTSHDGLAGGGVTTQTLLHEQRTHVLLKKSGGVILRNQRQSDNEKGKSAQSEHMVNVIKPREATTGGEGWRPPVDETNRELLDFIRLDV